jgi:hypothetical protein
MKKLEQQGDPALLEAQAIESSKGNASSYDAEASHLRKQQLLVKAKVTDYLIRYLNLTMGANENLAKTLDELDKIEVAAKMAIDEAKALHGDHLFTDAEVEHIMNQFKKHRPTDSNVFPNEPVMTVQNAQQEPGEIIDPPLTSYDKLESGWLARKMSKWLFNRKEETTERVVREAKLERKQKQLEQKNEAQKQKNLAEKSQEEKNIQSYISEYKKWKGLIDSDPKQAILHRMPFLAENAKEKAVHAYIKSGIENISLLTELGVDQNTINELKNQRENPTPEIKKESFWDKTKNIGRKIFTRFAFLTAGLSTIPTKTADTTLPPQEGKNSAIEKTITPTKSNESVLKTHAEIIAENPTITPIKQTKNVVTADSSKTTEASPVDTFDTSVLPTMKEVLEQRNRDSAEYIAKTNPDTILQTPVGQSMDTVVTTNTLAKDTIQQIDPAPLVQIKTKDSTETKAPDWTAPKPTPTGELNHPTVAPEAVGVLSAGANPNTFDTPSVSGGIKVSYQDKNGNALDTNVVNQTPKIVYAPIPKTEKQPEIDSANETPKPSTTTNESTIVTRRDAVGTPAQIEQVVHNPAIVMPASSNETDFFLNKIPLEQMNRGQSLPVPEGWTNKPIDTQMTMEKGTRFKDTWNIHEYRVRDIDGYKDVPYFFWKKLDTTIWNALKETPGASEKYIQLSEREGRQDPYVIQLWDGSTATEYIVNEIGRISAEPRIRTFANPNFGKLTASIKKNADGSISINGDNYSTLDELEKNVLDMTITQTGKEEFTVYSFHKNEIGGGSEAFQGDAFVIKETSQIKKEIQDIFNRIRNEKTIPLHRVERKVIEDGQTVIKVQWLPDEIQDPTYKERKVEVVRKKNILRKRAGTAPTSRNRVNKVRGTNTKKPQAGVVYDYSQQ